MENGRSSWARGVSGAVIEVGVSSERAIVCSLVALEAVSGGCNSPSRSLRQNVFSAAPSSSPSPTSSSSSSLAWVQTSDTALCLLPSNAAYAASASISAESGRSTEEPIELRGGSSTGTERTEARPRLRYEFDRECMLVSSDRGLPC